MLAITHRRSQSAKSSDEAQYELIKRTRFRTWKRVRKCGRRVHVHRETYLTSLRQSLPEDVGEDTLGPRIGPEIRRDQKRDEAGQLVRAVEVWAENFVLQTTTVAPRQPLLLQLLQSVSPAAYVAAGPDAKKGISAPPRGISCL